MPPTITASGPVVMDCLVGDAIEVRFTAKDERRVPVTLVADDIHVVFGLVGDTDPDTVEIELADDEREGAFSLAPDQPGTWGYVIRVTNPVRAVQQGLIRVAEPYFP